MQLAPSLYLSISVVDQGMTSWPFSEYYSTGLENWSLQDLPVIIVDVKGLLSGTEVMKHGFFEAATGSESLGLLSSHGAP